MKIVVIESSLGASEHRGHPDHFIRGFADLIKERGIDLTVLSHSNNIGGPYCEALVRPVISLSLHERLSWDAYDGGLVDFMEGARRFYGDLVKSAESINEGDLVLLPTASYRELAGIGAWLHHLQVPVRVAALFHWAGRHAFGPGSLDGAMMRQAARRLDSADPIDVWFCATQAELARSLAGPLGRPVDLAPSLTFLGGARKAKSRTKPKKVGILGGTRIEKGEELIGDLVELIAPTHPQIEFVLQDHRSMYGRPTHDFIRHSNVTIVDGWLDEQRMDRLVQSLDLAILPYDRGFYSKAVSGIFTLMAGAGVPCIIPDATWMSEQIDKQKAAGIPYAGSDVGSVASAFYAAVRDYGRLSQSATDKVDAWRKEYSAQNFVDELLRFSKRPT